MRIVGRTFWIRLIHAFKKKTMKILREEMALARTRQLQLGIDQK